MSEYGHAGKMVSSDGALKDTIKRQYSQPFPLFDSRTYIPAYGIDMAWGNNPPRYTDIPNHDAYTPVACRIFNVDRFNKLKGKEISLYHLMLELRALDCPASAYTHNIFKDGRSFLKEEVLCLPVKKISTREGSHPQLLEDTESTVLLVAYLLKRKYITTEQVETTLGASYLIAAMENNVQEKLKSMPDAEPAKKLNKGRS